MADNLFNSIYNPDVLECIANLSNDEVFTPPAVANAMLDMLPQELFRSPDTKFLDPATKSGVFLREIAKRLLVGLEDKIPNLQERVDHIFQKQLYGIAITELTSHLARRSVYCSKYASGKYSVSQFDTIDGNIRFKNTPHRFVSGRCVFCGASEKEYGGEKREKMETHAYELIHTTKPQEILKMKFDVIIGNPPYQLSDGGQKASATPIYQNFISQAKKLNPRYLTMVIPARWYSGGRGLDSFRKEMLSDKRIRKLVDYTNSDECFPGVDIAGGICYFLWERDNPGLCEVTNIHSGKTTVSTRKLDEYSTFIRYAEALTIIQKVTSSSSEMMDSHVSSQKPFGLRTYVKPNETGDILLRYNGGIGKFSRKDVLSAFEWIDKYKVIMSYLTYDHAGRADSDGKRRIFSTMEILNPGVVCTETYLVVDVCDTKEEANNLLNYLKTKFVRFLVAQLTTTQHISKSSFSFVPLQDFRIAWTDEKLYEKYNLSEDETAFIDSMIKPMDLNGGDEDAK